MHCIKSRFRITNEYLLSYILKEKLLMNKIRFCINALFQQNHFMIYAALTCYAFLVDFYGPQTKKGKPLNKRVYESKITKYIDESER